MPAALDRMLADMLRQGQTTARDETAAHRARRSVFTAGMMAARLSCPFENPTHVAQLTEGFSAISARLELREVLSMPMRFRYSAISAT